MAGVGVHDELRLVPRGGVREGPEDHIAAEEGARDRRSDRERRRLQLLAESVLSANQALADNTSETGAGNGFEGYWRKNRRSLTGATVPGAQVNPDAFGVDPNRNYAYLWGDSNGGSSGSQVDQTYRGEAPFSEPEVANVRDIILSRSVTGVITNHTYQNSVLRTGGGDAPEDGILVRIGQKMADILGYENNPTVGYPTTGTTDDWAYAAMGALGFTIEHGGSGFHPAYAEGVGERNDKAMKAFTVMLDVSADPKYHSVITGKVAGGKAKLVLRKTFKTELSPGNPTGKKSIREEQVMKFTTDKDGSFELHVSPSSRPYEKKAECYQLDRQVQEGHVLQVDPGRSRWPGGPWEHHLPKGSPPHGDRGRGDLVDAGQPPTR